MRHRILAVVRAVLVVDTILPFAIDAADGEAAFDSSHDIVVELPDPASLQSIREAADALLGGIGIAEILAVTFAMGGLRTQIDAFPVHRSGGGGTRHQQSCGGHDHDFHCDFLRGGFGPRRRPDGALLKHRRSSKVVSTPWAGGLRSGLPGTACAVSTGQSTNTEPESAAGLPARRRRKAMRHRPSLLPASTP
ncbi:hypothetical protein D3C75_798160 [compost metagenome]